MNADIEKMTKAAKAGGEILRKYFGQALDISEKSAVRDYQTKADLESESVILEILKTEFPGFNIHSEEIGIKANGSEFTLLVDPLDGTNNFVTGIPNFSITIALLKGDEVVAGLIHQPVVQQTYYAVKGKGSFVDGVRLQVSKEKNPKRATIGYAGGYNTNVNHIASLFGRLLISNHKRPMFNWALANDLCLLALGRVEGFINEENEIYDFAAAKLICREAGAVITNWDGTPDDNDLNPNFIMANNQEILNALLPLVTDKNFV
ncbi:MAG: hypothetical protein A3J48_04700 [Candidatus Doudnabacteria bacterium RIFCSPHIGHO2_02_FULL_46_11]|uniref:Inositol-phosphate phosphatase n=1 Tax=Candidatus Doudnabacteria bacterium RIFCSPHIGHO2_02_FULL_46_11 TaxID=1817832 RepID=A0A1F5P6M1_9BACT|nr:MAG: hypothetical protein A3J48_04700 [Candidatus Doudnabacteria bacterium RIFCSPHIGHO2_02_FULL_46_11]